MGADTAGGDTAEGGAAESVAAEGAALGVGVGVGVGGTRAATLGTSVISMRRFFAMLSGETFGVTGSYGP